MIRGYWRKMKKPSYAMIFFIVNLFFFIRPVTVQRIIPQNIVSIEIKYRVEEGDSKRIVIDNSSIVENALDKYTYTKSLLYSFSMNSWYGDTIKIYFKDSDENDLILYVIKHELSDSILIKSSYSGLVYKVNGEYPEELYNNLLEIIK